MQLAQRHAIEQLEQLFEPLPDVLAFVDEFIDGHGNNCGLRNVDFGFNLSEQLPPMNESIHNPHFQIRSLVECVPNFSEGRKTETIDQIADAIESEIGVVVLNRHIDVDHNRSVITFVGQPGAIVSAAVKAVAAAKELIDLRDHAGVHPRIGATDVLPFVPVSGVTMDECVALAHEAGRRIWSELSIPVYFYERAALHPDRKRLEHVRGQGFEWLAREVKTNPDRAPDVGAPRLNESAGATVVGARPFLIAFNVNLRTNDLSIARGIAGEVRERDGGLPFLKALGFELESRGIVQVSMNLIDYEHTGISRAFDAVRDAASRRQVEIHSAEIVGLVPRAALDRGASYFPYLANFRETLVIERLLEQIEAAKQMDSQPPGTT
jgi:glutamate formiminotransferase